MELRVAKGHPASLGGQCGEQMQWLSAARELRQFCRTDRAEPPNIFKSRPIDEGNLIARFESMSPRIGKDLANFFQPASSNDINGVSKPAFNVAVSAASTSIALDYFQDVVENGLRCFNLL
jgi:hypothetical protein